MYCSELALGLKNHCKTIENERGKIIFLDEKSYKVKRKKDTAAEYFLFYNIDNTSPTR